MWILVSTWHDLIDLYSGHYFDWYDFQIMIHDFSS